VGPHNQQLLLDLDDGCNNEDPDLEEAQTRIQRISMPMMPMLKRVTKRISEKRRTSHSIQTLGTRNKETDTYSFKKSLNN